MTFKKPYLTARPANEGARRLVWLLLDREVDARKMLNERGIHDLLIDRMVGGEVTPGVEVGRAIFFVSDHAIAAWHWNQAPQGVWFERPVGWPDFGVLAPSERRAA